MEKKIAYYGGTFDPIHDGHIKIIKYLLNNNFDKVIIVPTNKNPLKVNIPIANIDHRLNMIKLAIQNVPNVEICLEEVNNINSYTYNTVMKLKEKYNNITLVLGTDIKQNISKWYKYDELLKQVNFLWITRQDNYKNSIKINNLPNVSSSEIRIGEKWIYLNKSVLKYIHKNTLYFKEILKYYTNNKSRVIHSINVAKKAHELANKNKIDANKAYIAGYLHDIAKYLDKDIMLNIMKNNYNKYLKENWKTYHAFVGSYIVKNKLLINDIDIINAIKYHTTGTSKKMTLFNMIIFLADKVSDERQYENVEKIRYIVNNDIIEAYKYIIKNNYKKFKNNQKDTLLIKAYKYWCGQNEKLN